MVKRDVYSVYRFCVEIEGLTEATFSECTGLQAEIEIFEWEEGGLNEYKHRLPGRTKYSNLTLKHGIATKELWDWCYDCIQGKVQRRGLSVILYGYDAMPKVRWDVTGALPIKWAGPTFKSGAAEAAVETLELAHHGFKRV
jgi:phage tail-like protein